MSTKRNDMAEMPFTAHLAELRTRIGYILIGLLLTTILAYNWVEPLFAFLTEPIRGSFGKLELIGTGPTEAFLCKLKVALAAGVVLSSPVTFHQIWLFIAPGLLPKERRYAAPFVICTTLFFLLGVSFCYWVVLPLAFQFFSAEFISINVSPAIRIGEYFGFVVKMALVFGIVFELPMLSYFLARFGLLTHTFLIRYVRHFIVGIFIVAGVLSPPDIISQLLLAAPLLVIYAMSIGITYLARKEASAAASADGALAPGNEAAP